MGEALRGGALFAGLSLPLVFTSVKHESGTVASGLALSMALLYVTTTKPSGDVDDAAQLQLKSESLVSTSWVNRIIRFGLAAVHLFAAGKFSQGDSRAIPQELLNCFGTFVLAFMTSIWATTGYYGQ
mmetsp:Transcript_173821/g.557098  ORF Transcript_173821/g.557098 Transcript_173821/m.557098 type:complete len:127 (-) Transcript_173821:401-781(-)